MAQGFRRWPRNPEAGVRSRLSPCEIHGRQFGTRTGFFPRVIRFPPVIIIPPMLHTHFYVELLLAEGQAVTAWEFSKSIALSEVGELWTVKGYRSLKACSTVWNPFHVYRHLPSNKTVRTRNLRDTSTSLQDPWKQPKPSLASVYRSGLSQGQPATDPCPTARLCSKLCTEQALWRTNE